MYIKCVFVLIISALIGLTCGSAIPIWELLGKDEKSNIIYTILTKKVADYCTRFPVPECEKKFIKSGLQILQKLDEDELDVLDPYQSLAENKIWKVLMSGSKLAFKKEITANYDNQEVNNVVPSYNYVGQPIILEDNIWALKRKFPSLVIVDLNGHPIENIHNFPVDEDLRDIHWLRSTNPTL